MISIFFDNLIHKDKIRRLKNAKSTCPCCGYLTLLKRNDYEICPVCFWQDDILDENGFSGANGTTLSEAQRNFQNFGACSQEMIKNVLPKNLVEKYGRK